LLYVVTRDLIYRIKQKIKDFQYIHKSKSLKEKLRDIEFVYMHSIIFDIAKLFGATKSDKIGLKQFKNISPKKSKDKLTELEKSYGDIFLKISNNRNRIIAHINISNKNAYFNMGFSIEEINKKIADCKNSAYFDPNDSFIERLKNLKAKNRDNERYSPSDFLIDIPRIEKFLNEFTLIIDEVNIYYCKK
ncbi:hypothetical protein KJ695_01975, partial [Patescibacteria group bacterium]|nr:hypothetical protein [Patescibacteria group bacterium]